MSKRTKLISKAPLVNVIQGEANVPRRTTTVQFYREDELTGPNPNVEQRSAWRPAGSRGELPETPPGWFWATSPPRIVPFVQFTKPIY